MCRSHVFVIFHRLPPHTRVSHQQRRPVVTVQLLCLHIEFNQSSPHLLCEYRCEDGGKGRVYRGNVGSRCGETRERGTKVELYELTIGVFRSKRENDDI